MKLFTTLLITLLLVIPTLAQEQSDTRIFVNECDDCLDWSDFEGFIGLGYVGVLQDDGLNVDNSVEKNVESYFQVNTGIQLQLAEYDKYKLELNGVLNIGDETHINVTGLALLAFPTINTYSTLEITVLFGGGIVYDGYTESSDFVGDARIEMDFDVGKFNRISIRTGARTGGFIEGINISYAPMAYASVNYIF